MTVVATHAWKLYWRKLGEVLGPHCPPRTGDQAATVDLLREGRKVIQEGLDEGLTDDEVIARVNKHLLQRHGPFL